MPKWVRMAALLIGYACLAASNAVAQEVEVTVEVAREATVAEAKEKALQVIRRRALEEHATLVEWDRVLKNDTLTEVTRVVKVGLVSLSKVKEGLKVTGDGKLMLTVSAVASVNDTELKRALASLDEKERLRAEVTQLRRAVAVSNNPRKSEADRAEAVAAGANSSVRLRIGDAQDMLTASQSEGQERIKAFRKAIEEMVAGANITVHGVQVFEGGTVGKAGLRVLMNWQLGPRESLERALKGMLTSKVESGQGDGLYGVDLDGALYADRRSVRWMATEVWGTRVLLEVSAGGELAELPVGFVTLGDASRMTAACSRTGLRSIATMQGLPAKEGAWCLIERGKSKGGELQGTEGFATGTTVQVSAEGAEQAAGPVFTWVIKTDGQADRRIPAHAVWRKQAYVNTAVR